VSDDGHIHGVRTKKLRVIPDERGRLMEMLRSDDDLFVQFGQAYVSCTYPGVVKGWHYHRKQIDTFICVQGMIKLVLYDSRDDSPTRGRVEEFFLGVHNPTLVQVPNGVYHGWMCISEQESIVVNLPSELYNYSDPDEVRVDPHDNDIPYEWARKDR